MSFKILSLDGGGVRGAYAVAYLAEIEQAAGIRISDYFDLIAGTSAGGITGVALAYGLTAKFIQDNFEEFFHHKCAPYISNIKNFHKKLINLTNPVIKPITTYSAENFIHSKYDNNKCYEYLKTIYNNKILSDISKTRLVIPAALTMHAEPFVFKTPHLPAQGDNYNFSLVDVIMATSAAPTYFDPINIENYGTFCDGGIWANCPAMVAYSEAINILTQCPELHVKREDILMLSIGTGHAYNNFTPEKNKGGLAWWGPRILEFVMESQYRSTIYYLDRIMHKRLLRINFDIINEEWGQFDNPVHIQDIMAQGKKQAQKDINKISQMFLQEKITPYKKYNT